MIDMVERLRKLAGWETGLVDEERQFIGEVAAELDAALERERVLREALTALADECSGTPRAHMLVMLAAKARRALSGEAQKGEK